MTDESVVALDQHTDLVRRWNEATKARLAWTRIEEQIKDELTKLMGDKYAGNINGELAVERKPVDQFQTTRFKKENPEMARFFTASKLTEYVDIDRIKETRPDLYQEYQTVKLVNHFDA